MTDDTISDDAPRGTRPSYSARDLERESGFDRRTIAYYVQEGLLPKVGRRGRRTRYPKLFLDRLLFIRRVREAEEAGEVPPVSLGELREVFDRMQPTLIAQVAEGRIAVTPDLVASPPTAFRLVGEPRPRSPYGRDVAAEQRLARDLARLENTARWRGGERRGSESADTVQAWSRVRVSPNIVLSVRGLKEEDAPLLDRVRRSLRRLIRRPSAGE